MVKNRPDQAIGCADPGNATYLGRSTIHMLLQRIKKLHAKSHSSRTSSCRAMSIGGRARLREHPWTAHNVLRITSKYAR